MLLPDRLHPRHLPRRLARLQVFVFRRAGWDFSLLATLGAMIAISGVIAVGEWSGHRLLLATFGPTSLLVFAFPQVPFARPRNILGGYAIASVCGLAVCDLIGHGPWAPVPAVGLAMFLMLVTNTVHPPATGLPILIALSSPGWDFLFFPVLAGGLVVIATGYVFNKLGGQVERQNAPRRRHRRRPSPPA